MGFERVNIFKVQDYPRRLSPPIRVGRDFTESPPRRFRKCVLGKAVIPDDQGGLRSFFRHHADEDRLAAISGGPSSRHALADGPGKRIGIDRPHGDKDDDERIDLFASKGDFDRSAEVLGRRRGNHVYRVFQAGRRRQEGLEPGLGRIRHLRKAQARRLASVGAKDARTPGVGYNPDPSASRKRLAS